MAYRIILDPVAEADIAALPPDARSALDDVVTVLSEVPWNGWPSNKNNPDGEVRMFIFAGTGMITYLIVEHAREVHVLEVYWAG